MSRSRARPRTETGFTLVELMIAVAISGILSTVAIPAYLRYVESARDLEGVHNIQKLASGARAYIEGHEGQAPAVASSVSCTNTFGGMCHGSAISSGTSAYTACTQGGPYTAAQLTNFRTGSYAPIWSMLLFEPGDKPRFYYYYHLDSLNGNPNYLSGQIYADRYQSCTSTTRRVRYSMLPRMQNGTPIFVGPTKQIFNN
ncbi:MAG: pilin [Deltaproteobacteria bacterium]|nr:pilin [Deltaproteobacteria bacterium]